MKPSIAPINLLQIGYAVCVLWLIILIYLFASLLHEPADGSVINKTTYTVGQNIFAAVIPHHTIVQESRISFLKRLSDMQPDIKTIILVSPNHANGGDADIQTSTNTWSVQDKIIYPNKEIIARLTDNKLAFADDFIYSELGITTIIPDIAILFAQAKIVPLIIKMDTSYESITKIAKELSQNCDHCLVLASVDFSHYQPALVADMHDTLSLRALMDADTKSLYNKAETDSPPSLALLALFAKYNSAINFKLVSHSNSGTMTRDGDNETTTHILGYYTTASTTSAYNSATFAIGGDMMFARGIARRFGKDFYNAVAGLTDRFFWGVDLSIINLEGAVSATNIEPHPDPHTFTFVFPRKSLDTLHKLHIRAVSMANNHANNADTAETRDTLTANSLQWCGGPTANDIQNTVSTAGKNISITIICVNALSRIPDITPIITQHSGKQDERVIVFAHWGDEYSRTHNNLQQKLAYTWIDAGADFVIGTHPHVLQDVAVYKGVPIVYSIGNLLFDQSFSTDVQQGLLVTGEFTDKSLKLVLVPTQSHNWKPQIMRGADKSAILAPIEKAWKDFAHATPAGIVFEFDK